MGKGHSGGNSGGLNYRCSPRGIKIGRAEEITWAHLIKLINLYISPKVKQQPEPENIVEPDSNVDQQLPGQMSVQDYPEILPDSSPVKMVADSTQRMDDCECIYCHHVFDGREACNGNMDNSVVECPKCGKEMGVSLSIEYLCYSIN